MASITIRNLDERVKKTLRLRAAENGRSLEAEARDVLTRAAGQADEALPKTGYDLFKPIRDVVAKYGGVELKLPPRTPMRPLPIQIEPPAGRTRAGVSEGDTAFRPAAGERPKKRRRK